MQVVHGGSVGEHHQVKTVRSSQRTYVRADIEEVEETNLMLSDIVKSNYYSYSLYSARVEGREAPDDALRGKCVAGAHKGYIDNIFPLTAGRKSLDAAI
jgi:hypothetical protein